MFDGNTNRFIERAVDAPIIRQMFSSSPRDPRYHMLSYISSKFSQEPKPHSHEPRAALFLNRFTRTLTIMYATNGLAQVLGITANELVGKSFYFCIQENCLQEAVHCLESAKANDSIAYLRFWYRDPREGDTADQDETMSDAATSDDDDDDCVNLNDPMETYNSDHGVTSGARSRSSTNPGSNRSNHSYRGSPSMETNSRSSSGNSTDLDVDHTDAIFDRSRAAESSSSDISSNRESSRHLIELEAVVSCTSDGLVVILRSARPLAPPSMPPQDSIAAPAPVYTNGLFASPWAVQPIMPANYQPYQYTHFTDTVHTQPRPIQAHPTPFRTNPVARGPLDEDFMNSIREVAVFAWSLTGINGSLAQYGRGKPSGEAQPNELPIWDPGSSSRSAGKLQNGYTNGSYRQHNTYWPNASGQGNESWPRNQQAIRWNGHSNVLTVYGEPHGAVSDRQREMLNHFSHS